MDEPEVTVSGLVGVDAETYTAMGELLRAGMEAKMRELMPEINHYAARTEPLTYESVVDHFHEATWPHVVVIVHTSEPEATIERVRLAATEAQRWVEDVVRTEYIEPGAVYLTTPTVAMVPEADFWSAL